MRIPKKFKLFGQEVKVEFQKNLSRENDSIGSTRYRKGKILLQSVNPCFSKTTQEQTFLHELIHWIFAMLRENELNNNEKLIDQIAGLLHQAFTTAEY